MIGIFRRDGDGKRPVFGEAKKFQEDPHWRDCLPFHEFFHGDTGAGLGASHQTGWTGLVANMIDEWRRKLRRNERENSRLRFSRQCSDGGGADLWRT